MTEWTRPLPAVDGSSAEFWRRCWDGRLSVQRCLTCSHMQFYPRLVCTRCGGDPELVDVSGEGTIYTFTVVRQNGAPSFRDELPYVLAMVELAEGPMMMGNVIGCSPDDVSIGMPVVVEFIRASDDVGVPMWRLKQ